MSNICQKKSYVKNSYCKKRKYSYLHIEITLFLLQVYVTEMLFKTLQAGIQKSVGRFLSSTVTKPIPTFDKLQAAALKEQCYLVDENDRVIGQATKKDCHLVQKDGTIPLHRAFSVFLFNSRGDMLLQKRSSAKITYPDCYTNACCSHPVADFAGEDNETSAVGIKKAAQRRLNYELGIPPGQMPLDKFKYLTRIHYYDIGNGQFGEHEIDYILFLLADVDLNPNPNEVSEISFIPKDHMHTLSSGFDAPLTPWFNLILKNRLRLWWGNLDDLDQFVDHSKIHKLN